MAVIVAQVAEPATARPCFQLQGKRLSFRRFVSRPELFQQGIEGYVERGIDENFLGDIKCQVFKFKRSCSSNHFSFSSLIEFFKALAFASARSLIRLSWCCQ